MDTQGDGICCGWGSGSYSVTHNGVKYNRDGRFGPSESITLCEEPATPAPTPEPVDCSTCDGTCIEMITKTDSNPEETRLRLKDTNKNQWLKERNYGDYSSPKTLYTDTMCVPDSCFMLMAQDKGKNGFGNIEASVLHSFASNNCSPCSCASRSTNRSCTRRSTNRRWIKLRRRELFPTQEQD